MNDFVAIIAARKGSTRLPNKHILAFGNSNILIHKIRQLKKISGLSKIIVSSDCDVMLQMAEAEGVLPHKRAKEYCDEETKSYGEVVAHLASEFEEYHSVLWTPCVCPLVDTEIYLAAIEAYKKEVLQRGAYDCVISVCDFKQYLWDEKGPLNFGLSKQSHKKSQDLPEWHVGINAFFLARRVDMIAWQFHVGSNPYRFVVPKEKSIDIDDGVDFEVALALHKKALGASR